MRHRGRQRWRQDLLLNIMSVNWRVDIFHRGCIFIVFEIYWQMILLSKVRRSATGKTMTSQVQAYLLDGIIECCQITMAITV